MTSLKKDDDKLLFKAERSENGNFVRNKWLSATVLVPYRAGTRVHYLYKAVLYPSYGYRTEPQKNSVPYPVGCK